jgi:hypothetical protein
MRSASLYLLLAASFGLASCSDANLSRLAPKLDITAYQDDNTYYVSVDDENKIIDLGEVPVFATKYAIFKLDNPSTKNLNVAKASYSETVLERWGELTVDPPPTAERFTSTEELDFAITAGKSAYLRVPFSPALEGEASAVISFESDAANGKVLTATVKGKGVFTGAPSLEVEYGGYRGPSPADCVDVEGDGRVDGCTIPIGNALDFGNIGLGSEGTARLILRNTAGCTPFQGVNTCALCKVTVDKDPSRQNIGIGFKAGTNDASLFSFEGSTQTPFDIQQRNLNPEDACSASGEIRFLLKFQAPTTDGEYRTTIVVESNDPMTPLVEIPVVAKARNAPIAIAKFKTFDPLNPSAPFTDPASIEPLGKVYFDGSASYDPRDPPNSALIVTYLWTVESYPIGADPNMFQLSGQNSKFFNFWLPLAGHYVVRLVVTNDVGIQSGDTEQCRVEFDVVYGEGLNIELSWDNATNDQDLHLVFKTQYDRVCNIPWDCHWVNLMPIWFTGSPAGTGPNPWLDIDDTNGLGPEHIKIKAPQPGTYRIFVHYYGDYNFGESTPTRETLRIYFNGIQASEYRRTLPRADAIWAVADVNWAADGTATVTPYPSDAAGEVGAMAFMTDCSNMGGGWVFP